MYGYERLNRRPLTLLNEGTNELVASNIIPLTKKLSGIVWYGHTSAPVVAASTSRRLFSDMALIFLHL